MQIQFKNNQNAIKTYCDASIMCSNTATNTQTLWVLWTQADKQKHTYLKLGGIQKHTYVAKTMRQISSVSSNFNCDENIIASRGE